VSGSASHAIWSSPSSVSEALEVLAEGNVDVVLSDLAMPDQDGYDLLAAIRQNPRWKNAAGIGGPVRKNRCK
jgi:CheY-like chemotaxis protein